ncbi:MAG: hypothetical protein HYZ57_14500 [Acidobacteria bacterium]|nr:hypothetical protein [Acidobacteriota bacterium]MBI3281042.1 hypothetical protein [Acidobacteriota bacterium]
MDPNAPVTQQQLQEALENLRNELMEFMRGIETNMLRAFHGYAAGQSQRLSSVEHELAAVKNRLAKVEDRVLALETERPK